MSPGGTNCIYGGGPIGTGVLSGGGPIGTGGLCGGGPIRTDGLCGGGPIGTNGLTTCGLTQKCIKIEFIFDINISVTYDIGSRR